MDEDGYILLASFFSNATPSLLSLCLCGIPTNGSASKTDDVT